MIIEFKTWLLQNDIRSIRAPPQFLLGDNFQSQIFKRGGQKKKMSAGGI